MKKIILTIASLLCVGLFCAGCDSLFNTDEDLDGKNVYYYVHTKYGEGEVVNEGERQCVSVGQKATLSAKDTDEYAFSHWEYLNEIVSYDKDFVLRPTKGDLDVRQYYAVFTPKDPTMALLNVICKGGNSIESEYAKKYRLDVAGGGYYQIGDVANLYSTDDGIGIVRTFAYDEVTVDGPTLELPITKSVNVTANVEKMVYLTIADNAHCTFSFEEDDGFLTELQAYTVEMQAKDQTSEYVPDVWQVKNALTEEVVFEQKWEEMTTFKDVIGSREISLHRQLVLDLVFTNENVINTLDVEIISSTGDVVGVDVEKPAKMIRGRGFPMWIKPDETTYIQDIYQTAPATEEFPFASSIVFRGIEDIYENGGQIYVPDPTPDFGEGCKVVMEAIPREAAVVVKVISNDDYIYEECKQTGNYPTAPYVPTLGETLLVIEKNKEFIFGQDFRTVNGDLLYCIYEVGYQFSHIKNENGKKISDTLRFSITASKNTTYYIEWKKKPVWDSYFDYTLTSDKTGYVAKWSELSWFVRLNNTKLSEISLPYTYNGKPVKEIADFGFSPYRTDKENLEQEVSRLPSLPFAKIVLPYTLERIGEKAFAGSGLEVVIPAGDSLSYISPDAFWSKQDNVRVNLTKSHLEKMLQVLHTEYIGENEDFSLRAYPQEHFNDENTLGHYESMMEYVCIKEDIVDSEISAFELCLIYHEFFHHYQLVAMTGVGQETLESMNVKPTTEEIEAWRTPYDTTDYTAYWNHPMEVSAREFAEEWTGVLLQNGLGNA